MPEYLTEWEDYVAEHYKPETMNRCQLDELYKIADIMKDMAEYWSSKEKMRLGN